MILGIAGIYISSKGYRNGWYLVFCRMLIFLPFYAAGNFYKNVLEKKDMQKNIYYFGFIFAVQLVMITVIGYPPYYDWAFCSNFVNGPIVPYILGFTGIAFWLRIARILTPLLKDNQLMLMIANNTYSIMLHHLLGIMFVKTVFAAISKFTGYCQDFDWLKYKSDLWWSYWPKGLAQWGLIYLVAGIAVGLIWGVAEKKIVKQTKMFLTNKRLTGYVNRNT